MDIRCVKPLKHLSVQTQDRPIHFLKTRASTFSTLTGNEATDKFGKAKRFITRSGTFQPERPVDELNQKRSHLRQKFSGCVMAAVVSAVVSAGSVLLINLVFTIWLSWCLGAGPALGSSTLATATICTRLGMCLCCKTTRTWKQ